MKFKTLTLGELLQNAEGYEWTASLYCEGGHPYVSDALCVLLGDE